MFHQQIKDKLESKLNPLSTDRTLNYKVVKKVLFCHTIPIKNHKEFLQEMQTDRLIVIITRPGNNNYKVKVL